MTLPAVPTEREQAARPAPAAEAPRRGGLTPFSLLLVLIVAYVMIKIQLVLVLVLLSLLFATIIERPVNELERRHVPRGLSILTVYIAIIGTIALGTMLVAPLSEEEADRSRAEAPPQLAELRDDWLQSRNGLLSGPGADALDRVIRQLEDPSAPSESLTVGIVTGIGGGVVGTLAVLVMAFYYLMEKSFLRGMVLTQVSLPNRERIARVWDDVEGQVGRWLRGQLTLCLIIGTASLIGYGAMDVRFWPLLGLWAGLTEAIPIIGPWLGGIPAVVMAMTESWDKALMVTGFVVLLQLTENTILVPRVMKGAVGLTPLTVFVAILAGTQYLNVAGALLAIPLAAAVQVIVSDYIRGRRGEDRGLDSSMPNWRWMRGQFGLAGVPEAAAQPPPPETPQPAASQSGSWTSQLLAQLGVHTPSHGSSSEKITPAIPPAKE
jgi:predicted PurR-regulated permease PerM